ncbi:hypothetical protein LEP1GSC047_4188 [Leptospira inadai serovar Lyme str. 10]|uniref:Lipoprotein n=2 Tax=Leptospira inadai serovar Lyme TaxID=293084 RepID=V6HDX1_9LEPT|nr:hypothetical protein [Leptospira inadai]EQA38172.1 hypothetical protein LEP1GSC047_4188 [Leptospira inadai serovar Lyme str. 10]PNV73597.1 hypothetical protein BES34_016950 [Leptospira inadai serovar Lyme]
MNHTKFTAVLFLSSAILVQAIHAQNIPDSIRKNIASFCSSEWTKRGILDRNMFKYCMNEQNEGWLNLQDLVRRNSAYPWIKDLKEKIFDKWTRRGITDWNMVHHSLHEEVEAIKDLEYGLKKKEFTKEKYDECFSQWGDSDSPWSMTYYCIKGED